MTSPWDVGRAPGRQPIFNIPPIVAWTAAILIMLYFIFALLPQDKQILLILDYAFIPARFTGLPPEYAGFTSDTFGWSVLTMITHAGLHGGLFHVIFNMAWLLAFGTPVARAAGGFGYSLIFVLSAVAGAAVFWFFHPLDMVPVVGASGAVSGMMGAAVRYLFGPGIAPLNDRRLLSFAAVWLVINLMFGLIGFQVGGETGQIAWEAHVGGFFAGLLLIPLVDRRYRYRA